jgi:hypothetical protein
MQAQAEKTLPPAGLSASTAVFAAFSILLGLTVWTVVPCLRDAFGISPIIGWYIGGTVLVLVPMLIYGCLMAWRELPVRRLDSLQKRLRVNTLNRGDVIWTIVSVPHPGSWSKPPVGTRRYLRHGSRYLSATSWARSCAGADTFCLDRRRHWAAWHGFRMAYRGACFTGASLHCCYRGSCSGGKTQR